MKKFKIKLPKKAKEFIALRADDLQLYNNRGGAKLEDLVVGVYAELAVYKYLVARGIELSAPDFSMHKKKSFGADLVTKDGIKYHVKGQSTTSQKKYGSSWLFQRKDRIIKNQKQVMDEWIVCCAVDTEKGEVSIILEKEVYACNFGECRLEWFRMNKVAIYEEDNL